MSKMFQVNPNYEYTPTIKELEPNSTFHPNQDS
uniref:Uncharacterized protein n=1 Tax=Arundo donax TaxID=35708 RepID=A0A0A8Z7B4_ARUDO